MTRLGCLALVVAVLPGCRSGPAGQLHKGTRVKLLAVKRMPELRREVGGQVQVFSPTQPGFDLAVARVDFGPATKDGTVLTLKSQDMELTDAEGRTYRAELTLYVVVGRSGHGEPIEVPFAVPQGVGLSRLRLGEAVFPLDPR